MMRPLVNRPFQAYQWLCVKASDLFLVRQPFPLSRSCRITPKTDTFKISSGRLLRSTGSDLLNLVKINLCFENISSRLLKKTSKH